MTIGLVYSATIIIIIIMVMMMMMMMMMILITIIIIIFIVTFKGAIRDLLQFSHSATDCLQHVRSSGQGAFVCKPRATHRALISRTGVMKSLQAKSVDGGTPETEAGPEMWSDTSQPCRWRPGVVRARPHSLGDVATVFGRNPAPVSYSSITINLGAGISYQ